MKKWKKKKEIVKKKQRVEEKILGGTIIYRCHVMYVFSEVQQRKKKQKKKIKNKLASWYLFTKTKVYFTL